MFLIVQQRSKTFEVNGRDAKINVLAGGGAAQTETPEVAGKTNIFLVYSNLSWLVYDFFLVFYRFRKCFISTTS